MRQTLEEEYKACLKTASDTLNNQYEKQILTPKMVGKALLDRAYTVIIETGGIGAWTLIKQIDLITHSKDLEQLTLHVVEYHKREKEAIRQGRARRKKDIQFKRLSNYLYGKLTKES